MATMTMTTSPEARRAPDTDGSAVPLHISRQHLHNAIRYVTGTSNSEARVIMSVAIDIAVSLRIFGDGDVPERVIRYTIASAMAKVATRVMSEHRYISPCDPVLRSLSGLILRHSDRY